MKCDKCGYSDNGSGDWAHACGPVAIQRQPVANERIRELINEATSFKEGDTEGKYDIEVFDKEKFAELIVKNVLDEVLQAMDDGMDVYDTVADKFGVEE
jgi:hypothetical protein